MKALVFTSLYPNNIQPHLGVFIKERMSRFARLPGCEAQVVAPVPYFPPIPGTSRSGFSQVVKQEEIEGLTVHHPRYFMTPKVGMSCYGICMFLSVLPTVRNILRRYECDVIDAHYVYPDGFAAVLLGKVCKKPVIVSARGSDINQYAHLRFIRPLLRYTLQRAERGIAVCQALKDAIVQLGVAGEKITVIPNGVDEKKFYPLTKAEARRRLHLPPGRILLSVGGLIPRKGFDLLIKALKIIREDSQAHNLSLVIVGDGPEREALGQLATALQLHEHVRFVGDVPHHQLYPWYSAADLFCLASSREGWPNVVLESFACGTPVVATDVWGIPEIIRSDQIGLLTKRDEHAIATTITRAFQIPWSVETLVAYARKHTWDRTARAVLQVFQEAVDDYRLPSPSSIADRAHTGVQ
ncbi:MAG: glycosyltransferase family 4 protein [Deltaproteobacteria bacterium]|nr:glycosyltransferase family 4 protein [Deltaproteobacteria bacterium]